MTGKPNEDHVCDIFVVWVEIMEDGKPLDPPKYAQGISQSENRNIARAQAASNARTNAVRGKTTGKLPRYAR